MPRKKKEGLLETLKRVPSQNKFSAGSRNNAGVMGTSKYRRHPKHKKGGADDKEET